MTADLRAHLQSSLGDAYTVQTEIGGGGMSRVYIAEDTALHRRIVVKVLPPELAEEVGLARFQREIRLAARLQHPHIVPLLACGETQGLPYYTMPFVEGESLRQRLDRVGELPVAEAVRLLREIASALAYAHDTGVVHRDIKPANVLLSGGIALVADFGVAKAVMASMTTGGSLTSTGIAVGTPAYMSPEQVTADPGVDHRADLYSFGMVAYEMLAGHSPFIGRSAQALLSAHVIDTPEPLEKRRPAVPLALAALVMRCLEKRPADRPQDAHEIIRALDALVTPSGTVAASGGARVAAGVAPRRISRARLGAIAIFLVVAGGGTWLAFNHRGRGAAAESRLLVAPFTNLTGNPAFDHVGQIAADQLTATVAQAGAIEVVDSRIVLQSLHDITRSPTEAIQRLAEATKARFVVTGTVVLRGDSLALQGQMVEARTGKVVAGLESAMSPTSDPIPALNALGDHLLGVLGIRSLAHLPQHGYRAPSYAAYQAFAKGVELFAGKGDFIGSRPFLRQAIALDSTFMRAYLTLEQAFINTGEFERADSVIQRMEQFPQHLTAAERIQLVLLKNQMTGDLPGQLQALQQLAALDSSALWLELTGVTADALLRPDLAVPAFEGGRAVYAVIGTHTRREMFGGLLEAYHQAGMHDRELRLAIDLPAKYPDVGTGRIPKLRAYAGLAQGRKALALADTMFREATDSSGLVLQFVDLAAEEFRAHGDTTTTAALLKMARQWFAMHPAAETALPRQSLEGLIFLSSGMADSAVVRFAPWARKFPQIQGAGFLAVAQAIAGDRVHAQATADSLGALSRRPLRGEHTFWQGAIVAALGDHASAVQLLKKARDGGRSMALWHYYVALDGLHGYPPFEALIRPKR